MLATSNNHQPASLEEQQQRWLIDNLDSLEQYPHIVLELIMNLLYRQLNNLQLPDLTPQHTDETDDVALERLEFDLKHSREHLSKLKFNFLELSTKRRFLEMVVDELSWSQIACDWAPGPLKGLERDTQAVKDALKQVKIDQEDLRSAMDVCCQTLASRLEAAYKKRQEALSLVQRVRQLLRDLQQKQVEGRALGDDPSSYSLPDLQARRDKLQAEVDKKKAALSVQRQAVSDLTRLLSHQTDQLTRSQSTHAALQSDIHKMLSSPQSTGAVSELCRWYRQVVDLVDELTGVHCDIVRPDYLHVTVTNPLTAASVPIHLHIDPNHGRLLSVSIGSTASTPKMHAQWRDLIDFAVKHNDIPLLIRQVHYKLVR